MYIYIYLYICDIYMYVYIYPYSVSVPPTNNDQCSHNMYHSSLIDNEKANVCRKGFIVLLN